MCMLFLLINQWKDHKKEFTLCIVFQTTEFPEQYKGIIIIFTSTSLPVVKQTQEITNNKEQIKERSRRLLKYLRLLVVLHL